MIALIVLAILLVAMFGMAFAVGREAALAEVSNLRLYLALTKRTE